MIEWILAMVVAVAFYCLGVFCGHKFGVKQGEQIGFMHGRIDGMNEANARHREQDRALHKAFKGLGEYDHDE